jgi:trans-2,3-dihydro-3-hydroxyanthranilate isomerase
VKTYRYNTLNVFTDSEQGGNPLAVFVQAEGLSELAMQRIAADLNLSETVFVFRARAGGHARVRIFTPTSELNFAGHPLVGAAWILGTHLVIPHLRLETGAGTVDVELERLGDTLHRAHLRGPVAQAVDVECDWVPGALGLKRGDSHVARVYRCGMAHCLVDVGSVATVATLRPNLTQLAEWTGGGVLAFAKEHSLSVRYFAPSLGVPEDPATGSAALALGHYLRDMGRWDGSERLELDQVTASGRVSGLTLSVRPDSFVDGRGIWVGGGAVVTGRGERLVRS